MRICGGGGGSAPVLPGRREARPRTHAYVAHVDLEVLEHDADQPLLLARGEAVQHPPQHFALVSGLVQLVQNLRRGATSVRPRAKVRRVTHRVDVTDGRATLGQRGTVLQNKLQNGGEVAHRVAGRDAAGPDLVRILRAHAVSRGARSPGARGRRRWSELCT